MKWVSLTMYPSTLMKFNLLLSKYSQHSMIAYGHSNKVLDW